MHRSRFWKYDNRRSTIHVVFERVLEKKSKEEPISNHSREEGAPGIQLELHLLWIPYPCDLSLEPMWQDPSTGSLGRTADGHFPIFPYQLIISVAKYRGEGGGTKWCQHSRQAFLVTSFMIMFDLSLECEFVVFKPVYYFLEGIIYLWITLVNWM